jgi:hypothetical protein
MNEKDAFDAIIEGMKKKFENMINNLNYIYLDEGTIKGKNKDGSYQVKINNRIYTIDKFDKYDSKVYQIDTIVIVLVEHKTKIKYILCQK